MELGLLIRGGQVTAAVREHFQRLIKHRIHVPPPVCRFGERPPIEKALLERLELPTPALGRRRSIQLSYSSVCLP